MKEKKTNFFFFFLMSEIGLRPGSGFLICFLVQVRCEELPQVLLQRREYTSLLLPYPSPHTQHPNFLNSLIQQTAALCRPAQGPAPLREPPTQVSPEGRALGLEGSSSLSMAFSGQGGQASGLEDKRVTNLSKVKSFTFGNYLLLKSTVCLFFRPKKKLIKNFKITSQ